MKKTPKGCGSHSKKDLATSMTPRFLTVRWHSLRFCDFKSVLDYNSEALRIKSLMEFCGKEITNAMLIEKTLSTFPVSALIIAKNYQIYVNARRITRFHELIGAINVAEKHDNILVKNYNSRSVETEYISESNYSRAPKRGCQERKPNLRDTSGHSGLGLLHRHIFLRLVVLKRALLHRHLSTQLVIFILELPKKVKRSPLFCIS